MDSLKIANIIMPITRAIEIGGAVESKETTMASGKVVQDVIGYRVKITANWEWIPQDTLSALVPIARSGQYVRIDYPDPAVGDTDGMFKIEIGNQKVFKFKNGTPYWYNVELSATAQEVI